MDREEVEQRLKNGENPLDLSIEKWEDAKEYLKDKKYWKDVDREKVRNMLLFWDNCALCHTYRKGKSTADQCRGCPVARKTGRINCLGSPYKSVTDAYDYELQSLKPLKLAVDQEIEFLKSLKEDGNHE